MAIYLGTNNIIKMYKGTTEVSKVYLGSNSILEPSSTPTPTPTPSGSFALKMSFDTPFDNTSTGSYTWQMGPNHSIQALRSNLITQADSTFAGAYVGKIKTSSTVKKVGTGSWSEPTLFTGWDNWAYMFFNNSNETELFADTWFYAPKIIKQMQEVEGYDANNPNIVEEWGGPTDEWWIYPNNRILGFKYNSNVSSFITSLNAGFASDGSATNAGGETGVGILPSSVAGDYADLIGTYPILQFYLEPAPCGDYPNEWYEYHLWALYSSGLWDANPIYIPLVEIVNNHGLAPETWHHIGLYRPNSNSVYVLFDGHIYPFNGVTLSSIPNIISVGADGMIDDNGSQIGYDEVRVSHSNPLTNFNLNTMTYDVPLGE